MIAAAAKTDAEIVTSSFALDRGEQRLLSEPCGAAIIDAGILVAPGRPDDLAIWLATLVTQLDDGVS